MPNNENPEIAILGSINLDNIFKCQNFPKPGETILCDEFFFGPGGKGLNQAIASVRNGVSTKMLGAIGKDSSGEYLLNFLKNDGVNIDGIEVNETIPTGVAHIIVDANSENSIVVAGGANQSNFAVKVPESINVILSQLETPIEIIEAAFTQAKQNGAICMLNCAPVNLAAVALFGLCDILIMNEHELKEFAKLNQTPESDDEIYSAAESILIDDNQTIIVTLGSKGVMIVNNKSSKLIKANKVKAIDTTGAGDCFCGVFASEIAKNNDLETAANLANLAASIQVTRKGAAAAMPFAQEINP